jgi:hypothetical protein
MPATWKKIIVSGSNAELNSLNVTTNVTASFFTGSFVGDGTGITGLTPAAITSYTNPADNRIITSVDGTTVNAEANLTFDGTTLTLTGTGSISGDLTVGGNLFVNGDLTNVNVTNLNVEDTFILLGSGSVSAVDAGIIFGGVTNATRGAAFFYDAGTTRLAYTNGGVDTTDTTVTPSGYVPVAYDVDGASQTPEVFVGNIKIEGGEIYIAS